MTPKEAWDIIRDNIGTDCGPFDEGWCSDELEDATEIMNELYSPEYTLKNMFPDSPCMWAPKDK